MHATGLSVMAPQTSNLITRQHLQRLPAGIRFLIIIAGLVLLGLFVAGVIAEAHAANADARADARADAKSEKLGWSDYRDPRIGFALTYPSKVFAPQKSDPTESLKNRTKQRSGRAFKSKDGKAWLQAAAFSNIDRISPQAFRAKTAAGYGNAKITYTRATGNFFVLSGYRGSEIFYERVIFSCGGRVINVWQLTYPTASRKLYDGIVEEVARTFRPVEGRERCS